MTIQQKDYDPALMQGAEIDTSNIGAGELEAADLATGSVTTVKIADANVTTAKIADGAVTHAKRSVVGAATATSDGLTTGLILDGETFVTVTSDSATKFITLPACAAAGVGQTVDLYVGATGYELVTPASSGDTISTVDSDQTNQLDVPANTLVRLVQVSATGWFAYIVAATTITVVAPDND